MYSLSSWKFWPWKFWVLTRGKFWRTLLLNRSQNQTPTPKIWQNYPPINYYSWKQLLVIIDQDETWNILSCLVKIIWYWWYCFPFNFWQECGFYFLSFFLFNDFCSSFRKKSGDIVLLSISDKNVKFLLLSTQKNFWAWGFLLLFSLNKNHKKTHIRKVLKF